MYLQYSYYNEQEEEEIKINGIEQIQVYQKREKEGGRRIEDSCVDIMVIFCIRESLVLVREGYGRRSTHDCVGPVSLIAFYLKSQLCTGNRGSYIDLLKELVSFAFAQGFTTVAIELKSFTTFTPLDLNKKNLIKVKINSLFSERE